MSRITIKDIAKVANVTPATVSMIINGKKSFKKETIERVMTAIKELKYTPSIPARRLVTQKTETIAYVIDDINNEFEIEILKGIHTRAIQFKYDLLFVSVKSQNLSYNEVIKNLVLSGKADGLVSIDNPLDPDVEELLKSLNYPFVMLENKVFNVDSVLVDNFKGGYLAGSEICKSGKKNVAVIAGDLSFHSMNDRLLGFKKALADNNRIFEEKDLYIIDYCADLNSFGNDLAKEISDKKQYDCYFIPAGDELAIGMMQYFLKKGYKIPKDISIIGFDDIPIAKLSNPPLTTIKQNSQKMGEIAFDLFYKRYNEIHNSDKITPFNKYTELIDPELVIRNTL